MIDFDEALLTFGKLLIDALGRQAACGGRILRDIYGRLSFVTPRDANYDVLRMQAAQALEAYGQPGSQLIVKLDETEFDALLAERSIGVSVPGEPDLRIIDRRLAGDDWLMRPAPLVSNPSRLIFYSVKGGVGRLPPLPSPRLISRRKALMSWLLTSISRLRVSEHSCCRPKWSQNTAWPTGSRQPQPVRTPRPSLQI